MPPTRQGRPLKADAIKIVVQFDGAAAFVALRLRAKHLIKVLVQLLTLLSGHNGSAHGANLLVLLHLAEPRLDALGVVQVHLAAW